MTVSEVLARSWGLTSARVTVHNGGMNSETWFVEHNGQRFVAKSVPAAARDQFVAGLAVAEVVERGGIPTGAPRRTGTGELVASLDGRPVALLPYVDGEPLTGSDEREQRLIGRTLCAVHRAVAGADLPDTFGFGWVRPGAAHLSIRDWLRPAVTAAVRDFERLDATTLTYGLLHTDPAPEAFRLNAQTGVCAVIDWGAGVSGPLLYDLASAVLYIGGWRHRHTLVAGYLEDTAPLSPAEVDQGLETMLRYRWAVQADYFAGRIVEDDRTGIDDHAGNEHGLEDARAALVGGDV